MNNATKIKSHLWTNLFILALSIGLAVILTKYGIFEKILSYTEEVKILGIFIAGMFFTSVLTVGPATVSLGVLAQSNSIWLVAAVGALGSVIGDFILFKFVRDRITDDFIALFHKPQIERIGHMLHLEIFRFFTPFIGALIVASPLPDEIGLAMMGLSKIKTAVFLPLSYCLNFLGIVVIGVVAKTLL